VSASGLHGHERKRAASDSFGEAESKSFMGGFTEQVNDSVTCDNETEWTLLTNE